MANGSQPIVFTRGEIDALAYYAEGQSKHRTFRVQRDTANRLWVLEPNGTLTQIAAREDIRCP